MEKAVASSVRRAAAWALGTCTLFAGLYSFTQSGRFHVIDEYETFFAAQSLLDRGELAIVQVEGSEHFFGKRGRDGKPYAPYGAGQPILSVPFLAAARLLDGVLPEARPDPEFWQWLFAAMSVAVYSAIGVACFHFWLLRLAVPSGRALAGALLLGASTLVWTYATQYRSNSLVLACFLALLALSELEGRGWHWLRGTIAALAALVRPDALIGVAALGLYHAFRRAPAPAPSPPPHGTARRSLLGLAPYAIGGAAGLALTLGLNWHHFGDPFDEGYPAGDDLGRPAYRFGAPSLAAALALLFSPGKGLLVLSPVLLVALWRLPRCLKAAPGVALLGLGMGAAYVALFSAWQHYEGGWCFGPRFLVPVIPFVLAPILLSPWGPWMRRAVWIAAAAGVAVNLLAVSVNFLAVAVDGDYYIHLREAGRSMAYNVWHSPLADHALQLGAGLRDLVLGAELEKAPGAGLDFWWLFALKQSAPAALVAALAGMQTAAAGLGALWLKRLAWRNGLDAGEP